ncbi:hypothetical protein [Sinomicrobium sp.]
MKKIEFMSILAVLAVFISACSSDDDSSSTTDPNPEPGGDEVVTEVKNGILTEDETWNADTVYLLDGKVVVNEGVTLTIEPGTIIKGKPGQETSASALVVDQGGKLMAEGTADSPIIFTAEADNIKPGELKGTNLDENDNALWGGVIILGKAPISASGDSENAQIEGISPDEPYGQYGGTDPADNSGVIKYISIRHGGILIGQDNEINGLTLGGVGNGTTIENVEVVGNLDDGIEWFGGTVNVTNALVWAHGDDGFDTDQGWSGTLDNAIAIMADNTEGTSLEMDGPEGTTGDNMQHTLKNITLIGKGTDTNDYADFRDGLLVNLENVLAYGYGAGAAVHVDGADSATELSNGNISFTDWNIVLPQDAVWEEIFTGDYNAGDEAKFYDNAEALEAPNTKGADTSVFGWTYTAAMGVEF